MRDRGIERQKDKIENNLLDETACPRGEVVREVVLSSPDLCEEAAVLGPVKRISEH